MNKGYGPSVQLQDCDLNAAKDVEEVVTRQWTTLLVRATLDELIDDYNHTTKIMHWCFETYGISWSGFRIRWPFDYWIGFGKWYVEYAATGNGLYARYWFKRKQDVVLFKLTWL